MEYLGHFKAHLMLRPRGAMHYARTNAFCANDKVIIQKRLSRAVLKTHLVIVRRCMLNSKYVFQNIRRHQKKWKKFYKGCREIMSVKYMGWLQMR